MWARSRRTGRVSCARLACRASSSTPAVVPVYDVDLGDGGAFFTMKRVRGETLERIVALLAAGDSAARERYGRRRLLTAFVSVCLGVDHAHSRGVIHRDLKPANLMLGDYGEVYVLDWGVARVAAGAEGPVGGSAPVAGVTAHGSAVGTLGYMPPEQLEGRHDAVGPRSDVYALGAVLFEVLALQPLHPRTTPEAVRASTLGGVDGCPSRRGAAVPEELDEVCARALRTRPEERYASARELADAVERFLDGEGDRERRRRAAEGHTRAALDALAQSHREGQADAARLDLRRRALAELGRALALPAGRVSHRRRGVDGAGHLSRAVLRAAAVRRGGDGRLDGQHRGA